MKLHQISCLIVLILSTLYSCVGRKSAKFNEGEIGYQVSYDSLTRARIHPRFLPSTCSIAFSHNTTKTTFSLLSGTVTFALINDHNHHQFSTLLDIMGKKLQHTEPYDSGRYPALYAGFPQIIIDTIMQHADIKGLSCELAKAHYADTSQTFDIVYTHDIDITQPNHHTPFAAIDGVMLQFSLRMGRVCMSLRANHINQKPVPSSTFEVGAEYSPVDYKTITQIISAIQK